ncbi:hypothetical protein [Marininema halotolerans]|uniref:ABC-2 type transport system permease protein n=1 Tax=Marininema halotolerans TaxID=1155944 RepID=A0A1I6U332_9BACL|nr:hypothetical protein [Marininema halotolerans]SFS95677.1 hypothetical protein SAMN05444972_11317 [Marininema halotolerans]
MKKSLTISKLILTLWRKELLKTLDTRTKQLSALLISLSLLILGSIAGYTFTRMYFHTMMKDSTLVFTIGNFLNASIFTCLLFIIFKVLTSDRDQLSVKLSWFPVTPFEKNVGYFLPFTLQILGINLLIFSIILLPAFLLEEAGFTFTLSFFLGLILQSLFIVSLLEFIYNLSNAILAFSNLPYGKLLTLILLFVSILFYGLETISIEDVLANASDFDYNLFYLLSPLPLWLSGKLSSMNVNVFLLFGIGLGGLFLSFAALFLTQPSRTKKSSTLFRNIPMPTSQWGAVLVKEIKTQARDEENLLSLLLIIILTFLAKLHFHFSGNNMILMGFAGLSGFVALNSFGNDLKFAPLYRTYLIGAKSISLAKFGGLSLLAFIQVILYSGITLFLPDTLSSLVYILLILLNSTAILYVTGLTIPVHKKNTQAAFLAIFFLIILLIPITYILQSTVTDLTLLPKIMLTLGGELLICLIILTLGEWRFGHD